MTIVQPVLSRVTDTVLSLPFTTTELREVLVPAELLEEAETELLALRVPRPDVATWA